MELILPPWVSQHAFVILVAWWLFSNAASALPTPLDGERWYKFFFTLAHTIAGNGGRIMATVFPKTTLEVKDVTTTTKAPSDNAVVAGPDK